MLFLAVRVDGNTGSGVHLYCLRRRRYGIGQIVSRGRLIDFVGQELLRRALETGLLQASEDSLLLLLIDPAISCSGCDHRAHEKHGAVIGNRARLKSGTLGCRQQGLL